MSCYRRIVLCSLMMLAGLGRSALAIEPFEIHVHGDEVAEAGRVNLELQLNNFMEARREPDYEGEVIPNGTTHFNFEPSVGLGRNWEVAGHFLMGVDGQGSGHLGGGKVRLKYAFPKSEGTTVSYSLNGEIGYLTKKFQENGWGTELRPAVCLEGGNWHWHINPILGWSLSGGNGIPDLEFATRLGYRVSSGFTLATELYSEFGPANAILPIGDQEHIAFLVGQFDAGFADLSLGVGRGLTSASTAWISKFQIGTAL